MKKIILATLVCQSVLSRVYFSLYCPMVYTVTEINAKGILYINLGCFCCDINRMKREKSNQMRFLFSYFFFSREIQKFRLHYFLRLKLLFFHKYQVTATIATWYTESSKEGTGVWGNIYI